MPESSEAADLHLPQHWDRAYETRGESGVSWFQVDPLGSLATLEQLDFEQAQPLIDIGGGASTLVDRLLERDCADLSVLDLSVNAINVSRRRLGVRSDCVDWIVTDLLTWQPQRRYAIWHDRACFHFLTAAADRRRYAQLARAAIRPGGHLIVAAFAPDGPEQCSGLPVVRYDEEQLLNEFTDGFVPVLGSREEHRTPWGSVQPFTWCALRRTGQGA